MNSKPQVYSRPKTYTTKEELADAINGYFEYCEQNDKPLQIVGLISYLGISHATWHKYREDKEMQFACNSAKNRIEESLVEGALTGRYKEKMIQFVLSSKYGYTPKQDNNVIFQEPISLEDARKIINALNHDRD